MPSRIVAKTSLFTIHFLRVSACYFYSLPGAFAEFAPVLPDGRAAGSALEMFGTPASGEPSSAGGAFGRTGNPRSAINCIASETGM
jgi:hypothetical protein